MMVRRMAVDALRKMRLLEATYRAYELRKLLDVSSVYRNTRYFFRTRADATIPPGRLIVAVAGTADIESFLEGGALAAQSMRDILAKQQIELDTLDAILDFGCGCGRVVRQWRSLKHTQVWGTDYNAEAIRWCQAHLSFARFTVNHLSPPLSYADASFDFIYALSVFTHMPEALQQAWMQELARVLKPGGHLLLTTHGEHYLNILTESERAVFLSGAVVIRHAEVAGTNMCTTFHPPAYVRNILARNFDVVDFVAEGAAGNPFQDVFLLRKPTEGE